MNQQIGLPAAVSSDDGVQSALTLLAAQCSQLSLHLVDALTQKRSELFYRLLYRCIPDRRLKEHEVAQFLREVLGSEPSEELIEYMSRPGIRRRRLTLDEIIALEQRQHSRCATCGVPLVAGVRPQVDHIMPVSMLGLDDLANFQLLCRSCNAGKAGFPHWIAAVPYFRVCRGEPDLRLRYCVLSRDSSQCQEHQCVATALTSELRVTPAVGVETGGRIIFDNLITLCDEHFRLRHARTRHLITEKLKRLRWMPNEAASLGTTAAA